MVETPLPPPFQIIVLSMNRFSSLARLLKSVQDSDYGDDKVDLTIRFDRPPTPSSGKKKVNQVSQVNRHVALWEEQVHNFTQEMRSTFDWKRGSVRVDVSPKNVGLRQAWLDAWNPTSDRERAVIFEDDIETSPVWYSWLKIVHDKYDTDHPSNNHIAGFSLCRQDLINKKKAKQKKIPYPKNGDPFLYMVAGSHGFSPRASVWKDFVPFANCAIRTKKDVNTPGLKTSDWYNAFKKSSMWEQLFMNFADKRKLFTMYSFPKNSDKALAAHWREKGEHFKGKPRRDNQLAQRGDVNLDSYPRAEEVLTLDWGAEPVNGAMIKQYQHQLVEEDCFPSPTMSQNKI